MTEERDSDVKVKTALPFDEWKSRLLSRCLQQQGNSGICAWELDGDQEQWMMNEYTTFPHFGQVMAAATDPINHKAEIESMYMFGYYDRSGKPVFAVDPDTMRETGLKVKEKFDGLDRTEVLYYDWVLWFSDFDLACLTCHRMYCRRRGTSPEEVNAK